MILELGPIKLLGVLGAEGAKLDGSGGSGGKVDC